MKFTERRFGMSLNVKSCDGAIGDVASRNNSRIGQVCFDMGHLFGGGYAANEIERRGSLRDSRRAMMPLVLPSSAGLSAHSSTSGYILQ